MADSESRLGRDPQKNDRHTKRVVLNAARGVRYRRELFLELVVGLIGSGDLPKGRRAGGHLGEVTGHRIYSRERESRLLVYSGYSPERSLEASE